MLPPSGAMVFGPPPLRGFEGAAVVPNGSSSLGRIVRPYRSLLASGVPDAFRLTSLRWLSGSFGQAGLGAALALACGGGRLRLGGTTSGERSRYSIVDSLPSRNPRPFMSPLK